ncbi:hypothetical protein J7643_13420 [bacterium]|nr:hypothetical protein [bacterium]
MIEPLPAPATSHQEPRLVFGVMGAASGEMSPEALDLAYRLGGAIARAGCAILTGACPGLPHRAVLGAKAEGGLTTGISPAASRAEHTQRYGSPLDHLDFVVYTGAGPMGREVPNILSSDVVVLVGGRSGTLGEFAIAYEEGKLIGVLEGTGGITPGIAGLVELCNKPTGAEVLYDQDPEALVSRLLSRLASAPRTERRNTEALGSA